MQSPTGVLFRTLVMLACLVAIPLVALFGSSLPKTITTLLEGHWASGFGGSSGQPSGASDAGTAGAGGKLIANPVGPAGPAWETVSPKQGNGPAGALDPAPSVITPAVYEEAMPRRGGIAGNQGVSPMAMPRRLADEGVAAIATSLPAVAPNCGAPNCGASNGSVAAPTGGCPEQAPQLDHFSQIQQQLRQLGVTYYLLETWGNQRELFRFYCEVPIGGNPNFVRHFEATHAEPLQAMTQVLQQVASRPAPTH
jgi:hypothetical protein